MNFMVTVETLKYIDLYLPPFLKTKYIFSFFSFINLYHESLSTKYTYVHKYISFFPYLQVYTYVFSVLFSSTPSIYSKKVSYTYVKRPLHILLLHLCMHTFTQCLRFFVCFFTFTTHIHIYIFNL